MKKIICIITSVMLIATLVIPTMGSKSFADSDLDLSGNLILTFKDKVDKNLLYDNIKFVDDKGNNIDVLLNAISEKEVVVVPLYDMNGVKVKLSTNYKDFSVEKYNKQAFVGTKENLEKLTKVSPSFSYGINPMLRTMQETAVASPANQSKKESAVPDHSSTNVQVKGIDEADKVKTDGEYIYYMKDSSIVIVKADKGNMKRMSEIKYDNNSIFPETMYIDKDKLIVIGSTNNKRGNVTKTVIYDIKDKSNPKSVRVIEQEGYYFDSRKKGSELHVLTSNYLYSEIMPIGPMYKDELKTSEYQEISPNKMMIYPGCFSSSVVLISSTDVNKSDETKITSFVGSQDNIYMSENSLYLSYQQVRYYPFLRESMPTTKVSPDMMPMVWPPHDNELKSTIKKFTVQGTDIAFKAETEIKGWILNQFSMDEKDGYFRVAYTTDNVDYKKGSNLAVFDKDMKQVGIIENIAPGEKIHSVRFMGDRAYMVTFKNIDPFFVLDLKIPSSPKILGYLKIPGVSEYLHPYDENTIIGFGKDTITNSKDTAFYMGMKISLFDVTNVNNPIEKAVQKIGDRGTESEMLYDHKALMYDSKRGIMGFPITVAKVKGNKVNDEYGFPIYGESTFQGAYVYKVTKDKMDLKGQITHFKNFDPYNYSYDNQITRLIYIGDVIYTISNDMIMSTDINTMKNLSSLSIK